jgi:flavin-dependent dehydrogenase
MTTSDTDVLIAGAGTAGTYAAWRLASLGFKCTVLEKDPLDSLGKAIGPFHMEQSAFERFDIPLPEAPELMHAFERMTTWSPRFERSLSVSFPTLVMDKALFHQRLHRYAAAAGAELVGEAEVADLLFEGGILRGVLARTAGGEAEYRARLVIDASGIDGAVRTRMPRTSWFENHPVADEDTIFVYMETWRDVSGPLTDELNSFPSFIGWCAPGPGDTRIVGIGAGGSYDAARRRHEAMLAKLPLKGTPVGSACGRIPYRRPPFSLVDNSLMVVGDAACANKPFSGEGVTSGLAGCEIAARTAAAALAADDLTREGLWSYNVEYFRGQGAKFAYLTAMLPALMCASEDEMELFFELPGMMTEEGALALQQDFEVSGSAEALKAALPLALAIATRRLSASTMQRIARMAVTGAALKALYARYPQSSIDLGRWLKAARFFWGRAGRVKREYFQRG